MASIKKLDKNVLSVLNCIFGTSDNRHICEDPIVLSCGHYVCRNCLKPDSSKDNIKCKVCNLMNKRDLNQEEMPRAFNVLLEQNLDELFELIYDKFKGTINVCDDIMLNGVETIDTQIQYMKDKIEIRIESIKIGLDKVRESFNKELDEIRDKLVAEVKSLMKADRFDSKQFKDELDKLEEAMEKRENLSKETLYYFQTKIKDIQKTIHEYKGYIPKLEFKESESEIERTLVGEFIFEMGDEVDSKVIKKLRDNKNELFHIGCTPWDFTVLPNEKILVANYSQNNLKLYDNKMQLIKTIQNINNRTFQVIGITTNHIDSIFMCDYTNNLVIKTDLNFNQLAIFGDFAGSASNQVNHPVGICYYNQHIFVCDFNNKRIQKLDTNLALEVSYNLNYQPWYIKNINNIAMLRAYAETSIYFYDLNNFVSLKKYERHNGIIGVSKSNFYEYYSTNKLFYCYNKNGELFEEIAINGTNNLPPNNNWCSIFLLKSKLYLTNFDTKCLVVI